jgi:integrase
MPSIALDANVVRTTECPIGKTRVDLYDTVIPGFIVEIRSTGGKTYYLRYRDAHGKQKQYKIGDTKSLTFEQARNAAQTIRAKVVLGDDPSAEKAALKKVMTLEEFVDERYMPYVKGYKRSWETDESVWRNHLLPEFGKFRLDEITQQFVMNFHHAMKAKGYAAATSNRIIVMLRYIFNLAKKWEMEGAAKNPATGVKLFQENNKMERYLKPDEVRRLNQAIQHSENPQLKFIVPLLLLTGCRKRELLNAEWAHIDLERRSWRIPISKSGKARHVPLSDDVVSILNRLPRLDYCAYVVPNPKTQLPYNSVFRSWDSARKAAGLPEVRMHDLRHSFASFLINAGRSLYEVQNILGHSQLNTTQRYAHLSQATLLDATNAASGAAGLTVGLWENTVEA